MSEQGSYLPSLSKSQSPIRFDHVPARKLDFGGPSKNDLLVFEGGQFRVYLRTKPPLPSYLKICGPRTLIVNVPADKDRKPHQYKYTFSQIFKPSDTQFTVFDTSVRKECEKFLKSNDDCLVFSYGTTGAGKTYTVQGTATDPGLLPRILATIFGSLEGKLISNSVYRPDKGKNVSSLNETDSRAQLELELRLLQFTDRHYKKPTKTISQTRCSRLQSISTLSYEEFNNLVCDETPIFELPNDSAQYAVWVSFAEIYNENIYDLLDVNVESRKPLALAMDTKRECYIKGLSYVRVNSGKEAFHVYLLGKRNLSIHPTELNSRSSRSHGLFNIHLVKMNDIGGVTLHSVNRFTVCDLAGSERQKKTHNSGNRLRESQSINTSLLVLNRCFKVLRDNQSSSLKSVVPYRDSKLTKLFHKFLTGNGKLIMIVNVSAERLLLDETVHILNASAVAQEIVPMIEPRKPRQSRISMIFRMPSLISAPAASSTLLNANSEGDFPEASPEMVKNLISLVNNYKAELDDANLKLKLRNECLNFEAELLNSSNSQIDSIKRRKLQDGFEVGENAEQIKELQSALIEKNTLIMNLLDEKKALAQKLQWTEMARNQKPSVHNWFSGIEDSTLISQLKQTNQDLETRCETLSNLLLEAANEFRSMQEDIDSGEAQINELQQDNLKLLQTIKDLKDDLINAENLIARKTEDIEYFENQNKAMEQHIASISSQLITLKDLEHENEMLKEEIISLMAKQDVPAPTIPSIQLYLAEETNGSIQCVTVDESYESTTSNQLPDDQLEAVTKNVEAMSLKTPKQKSKTPSPVPTENATFNEVEKIELQTPLTRSRSRTRTTKQIEDEDESLMCPPTSARKGKSTKKKTKDPGVLPDYVSDIGPAQSTCTSASKKNRSRRKLLTDKDFDDDFVDEPKGIQESLVCDYSPKTFMKHVIDKNKNCTYLRSCFMPYVANNTLSITCTGTT